MTYIKFIVIKYYNDTLKFYPMCKNLDLDPERLNLFVAYTKKEQIFANNNDIPWKGMFKSDFKFLKTMTKKENVAVIMGRLTFESMPKPLDERINVVVSTQMRDKPGIIVKKTFQDAIDYCIKNKMIIVIFGGSDIYKEAMSKKCKFFITIIDDDKWKGNKKFPKHNLTLKCVNKELQELLTDAQLTDSNFYIENDVKFSFFIAYN